MHSTCGEVLSPLLLDAEAVPLTLQPNDYILDVMSMCERESIQYSLCFRKNTWLRPLRLTNNLMVDVLFYQVWCRLHRAAELFST